jgi:hydroxymethylpyrimidine kinase/phosphomethylpyrimidine kinase
VRDVQTPMTRDLKANPVVLAVAGFDPSGGAGIIADIKTIASLGCRPVGAITSLTFQNREAVFGATHESAESLRAQILPIIEEHSIAAVKTGMLPTSEIVAEVARLVREANLPPPVVDPVLRSSSGHRLSEHNAIEALLHELFPLSRLLTPNIPEAEALTGMRIEGELEMLDAAKKIRELGARAVLIKGGHLKPDPKSKHGAIDVLDNEGSVTVFRGERIDSSELRGTGCMLSSAIAAGLAHGASLEESVERAKEFVAHALRNPAS